MKADFRIINMEENAELFQDGRIGGRENDWTILMAQARKDENLNGGSTVEKKRWVWKLKSTGFGEWGKGKKQKLETHMLTGSASLTHFFWSMIGTLFSFRVN